MQSGFAFTCSQFVLEINFRVLSDKRRQKGGPGEERSLIKATLGLRAPGQGSYIVNYRTSVPGRKRALP